MFVPRLLEELHIGHGPHPRGVVGPRHPKRAPARRGDRGGTDGPGFRARPVSLCGCTHRDRLGQCTRTRSGVSTRRGRGRPRHHARRPPTRSASCRTSRRAAAAPSWSARPRRSRRWSSSPGASTTCGRCSSRLIPADGRLRAQPAQPRHQLARPPARLAHTDPREVIPVVGGRLGAGHLAAARADRLRRPPARADRDPSGDRLSPSAEPEGVADCGRRRGDLRGSADGSSSRQPG